MAKCSYCGSNTKMFVCGTPVCISCDAVGSQSYLALWSSGLLPDQARKEPQAESAVAETLASKA